MDNISISLEGLGPLEKHTMMLGLFARISGAIEALLGQLLAGLMEGDMRVSGAVVRWVSVQQQMVLINEITKDFYGPNDETTVTIRELLKDVERALRLRNDYLHSLHYEKGEASGLWQLVSAKRGKLDFTHGEASIEQMQRDVNFCIRALQDLDVVYTNAFENSHPPRAASSQDILMPLRRTGGRSGRRIRRKHLPPHQAFLSRYRQRHSGHQF